MKLSIDQFVDEFWPKPDLTYDHRIHVEGLYSKYPTALVDQFLRCCQDSSLSAGQRTFDLAFQYGMVDDVAPNLSIRGRETLKSLTEHLSARTAPFSLYDAGFGDGRISLGLAALVQNLEKLQGIDRSPYAVERLVKNSERLSLDSREAALRKITAKQGDYFNSLPSEKFDVALLAYPFIDCFEAIHCLRSITKRGGEIILCVDTEIPPGSDPEDQLSSGAYEVMQSLINSYHIHELDFEDITSRQYLPQEMFVVASAVNE